MYLLIKHVLSLFILFRLNETVKYISLDKKIHDLDNLSFPFFSSLSLSLHLSSVPSQPPQNVRAISVTSDEAVITWAEPPRMTLHGVLKGYRVVFWAVFPDGGELSVTVILFGY